MNDIIITENLSKKYKNVLAVNNISLTVRKGEIYGFLGLNGAGKTTTIKLLLGMIRPTSGTVKIINKDIRSKNFNIWNKIGYMVETPHSYPNLTVKENLEIIRRLRYLDDKNCIDSVIDKLKLKPYENRLAGNLSLGNAQRLGLAKALLHHPEILILDEPANSLDPAGILEIREMLIDLSTNHGVTILISSHILDEISRFATRIGIIHQGELIEEISAPQLENLCEKNLLVKAENVTDTELILRKNNIQYNLNNSGFFVIDDKNLINHPDLLATRLVNEGCALTHLQVHEEDLESYFLRTIEKKVE